MKWIKFLARERLRKAAEARRKAAAQEDWRKAATAALAAADAENPDTRTVHHRRIVARIAAHAALNAELGR